MNIPPRLSSEPDIRHPDDDDEGTYCVTNGALFSFLGDKGGESVYVCPTAVRVARSRYGSGSIYRNVARSYGMNGSLQNQIWPTHYYSIDGPSRRVMFADQGFVLQDQDDYEKSLMNTDNSWSDNNLPRAGSGASAGAYVRRFARNHDGCIDWRHYGSNHNNWEVDGGDRKGEHIGEYHNGRGNAVFCDGHVELVEYDNTRYICTGGWEGRQPIGDDPL